MTQAARAVAILVPALDEAATLAHVLRSIPPHLASGVIVIDGGSTDGTPDIARSLGVRVVTQTGRGLGDAIRAGVRATDADVIVTIDADGAHDGRHVELLLDQLDRGFDLVVASRMSDDSSPAGMFSRRRHSSEPRGLVRDTGNRLFTALCRGLLGVPIHDVLNGAKALRREVFLAAAPERDGQEHDVELLLKAHRAGFRIGEVAIEQSARNGGGSKLSVLGDGWSILRVIAREALRRHAARAPAARPTGPRCVFVHATAESYIEDRFGGKFSGPRFPPVWASTIAAYIPGASEWTVHLHDARFVPLADVPTGDIYLFSGFNQDLVALLAARAEVAVRHPGAVCAVGGPICASFDRSGDLGKLAAFDHVCVGDGEVLIGPLLESVSGGAPLPHVVRAPARFAFEEARPLHRALAGERVGRYYGALVEVSRGCPFLCEFCDVRIAPDNNRPHNRNIEAILADLDFLSGLGVKRFQLVCDDFIGDARWAESLLDAIIAWEDRTGHHPALYTWATLNLCNYPALMKKMRLAGVDMMNVGVESFDRSALLETAKVQNAPGFTRDRGAAPRGPYQSTVEAVRQIQSYGFVLAAGLIFGFDSDTPESFDVALEGIREAGVLSGDPHLLTALPGTPLYRRMELAGRLRDVQSGLGIRYQTNVRYLMPREVMVAGMMRFFRRYSDSAFQYARLVRFFENLERGNFVPLRAVYLGPGELALALARNPGACLDYLHRVGVLLASPRRVFFAVRGACYIATRRHIHGRTGPFLLWLLMWMNSVVKARRMTAADFDVDDVGPVVRPEHVLPAGYADDEETAMPLVKVRAQRRHTLGQLEPLAQRLAVRDAVTRDSAARHQ